MKNMKIFNFISLGVLLTLFSFSLPAKASTTVWLPAPGSLPSLTVTAASDTNPIVITVAGAAPANGSGVWCQNIGGNLNANGYFIVAGSSGSSFQETLMYYGGNVAGSGAYTSGGTCALLTAYTLQSAPVEFFNGPAGTVLSQIANTSTFANANNPPFAAMTSTVNNISGNYTNINGPDDGNFLEEHDQAAFTWYTNQSNTQNLAIARWAIDNFNDFPYGGNGSTFQDFHCAPANQCGNNSLLNWGAGALIYSMLNYTLLRSQNQLSSTEIQNFADMVLNDNDINHNGIGGSASNPTIACNNAAWNGVNYNPTDNYCGWTYLARHSDYSPPIWPGQEGHYESDYSVNGFDTGAGEAASPGNGYVNLTESMLLGDIVAGVGLCNDDVRACMLLTQAYSYWYQNDWLFAKSNWTAFTQGSARYSTYVWHPVTATIVDVMKNSTVQGLDLTGGLWLERALPYYIYMTLPDNPSGEADSWGSGYSSASTAGNHIMSAASVMALFPNDVYTPYENYWLNTTEGYWYTSGWLNGDPWNAKLSGTFINQE